MNKLSRFLKNESGRNQYRTSLMYTKQHEVQCILHRHDDDLPPRFYDAHYAVNTTRFAYLSGETLTGGLNSDMFLCS